MTITYLLILPEGRMSRPAEPRACVPARGDVISFGTFRCRVAERWLLEAGDCWTVFLTAMPGFDVAQAEAAGFAPEEETT